jgi:hypothetical protein
MISEQQMVVTVEMQVGIKFKKAHGEKDSTDAGGAEQWNFTKLPNLLIYSADETGLFLCFASCFECIIKVSEVSHNT